MPKKSFQMRFRSFFFFFCLFSFLSPCLFILEKILKGHQFSPPNLFLVPLPLAQILSAEKAKSDTQNTDVAVAAKEKTQNRAM